MKTKSKLAESFFEVSLGLNDYDRLSEIIADETSSIFVLEKIINKLTEDIIKYKKTLSNTEYLLSQAKIKYAEADLDKKWRL